MASYATPPPALVQVAERFSQGTRGIVAFRLHRVLDVHAGFSRRHEDLVLNGVYQDGTIVKVRVVSYTIDGKPASAAEQAAMAQAYQSPRPDETFAPPFDARFVAEYSCRQDAPGTIAFASGARNAAHGSGTFAYDAEANVVSYTYRPNALPPHASAGTIMDTRAEVLPHYWAVTQETQQYKGSYGPFSGTGTERVEYSDFRRFADLQSAASAL
jgi:hypothetical protein